MYMYVCSYYTMLTVSLVKSQYVAIASYMLLLLLYIATVAIYVAMHWLHVLLELVFDVGNYPCKDSFRYVYCSYYLQVAC